MFMDYGFLLDINILYTFYHFNLYARFLFFQGYIYRLFSYFQSTLRSMMSRRKKKIVEDTFRTYMLDQTRRLIPI